MLYLLQSGATQLDSDVLELAVTLRAKVADDVGVLVRLAQQLHLPVRKAEAFWENSLHCYLPVIKMTSDQKKGSEVYTCKYQTQGYSVYTSESIMIRNYLYTMVPSAPCPRTFLGLKVMFPTRTMWDSSSEERNQDSTKSDNH